MAQNKAKFDWRFLLLLPIPLLWLFLGYYGYLRFLDNRLLDLRFIARGEIEAPVNIIYVDIDSQSISELGNFPWPRSIFARTSAALINAGKAKAVGIDIVFSEQGVSESYDRAKWVAANVEFARFLLKDPPVVVAASYSAHEYRDETGRMATRDLPLIRSGLPALEKIPLPELPEFNIGRKVYWNPPKIGLIDTLEGGTRWVPLFAPTGVKRYDHMALNLALLHWGLKPEAVKQYPDRLEVLAPDGRLVAVIPLTDQQLIEINWFSRWQSDKNPRIGLSTVYNYAAMLQSGDEPQQKKAQEFFSQFVDAIVLVGPVDPLLQDLATTPFDEIPVPKVGVHGNLLKTIVSGVYLQRPPVWAIGCIVLGLTLAVSWLSMAKAGGAKGLMSKIAAALVLIVYVGMCFWLFGRHHLVLPMAAPLGAALSTSFAGVIWQLIVEEKQKGRIKNMFGTYLSPELVNRMVESAEDPKLGGHEEVITAYFSDIQSFSTFSEKMNPAQLVELMNEYLTACTEIVQEEGGTLDKYIGDAVVAIYGAPIPLPNHAYRACVATVRVQQRISELRVKWREETGQWPEVVHNLRARIGLNTGPAIIGNMGSKARFSYTMMGDNVNLAARMESGAKAYGVYAMITEATKLECEKHGGNQLVFRYLDKIVVKGRSLPVPVFEIMGFDKEVAQQTLDCLGVYARGIERYLAQDWDGASALFEKSAALEPLQPHKTPAIATNPSLVLIERCRYWKENPPDANWDGVFVMKEK
ncbi:MAG: adenylate/guanylate cyclase domain-containing protein [Opitutaceae bacterium]|nr:adenylate/guanylate cyclase domain-containing protein [Opitutaceae bacterium]